MRERLAELNFDQRDDILVAQVIGEIDSSNASELRLALTDRLPSATVALVLDLSDVGYVDSAGVELLFDLRRRLGARRQMIRLVVPPDAPSRRVLELCDVASAVPLDAGLDASLSALADSD